MRPTRLLCSISLLSLVACGGDSTGPNPGSNNCAGGLSATVNGAAWCSPAPAATVKGTIVSVAGLDAGLTGAISFAFVGTAAGTYSLAVGNFNAGIATYTKNGQGWGTGFAGGTGSVTVTTLTSNHVVGTFTFDAAPVSGGATGTVHVTNGVFNITF